MIAEDDLRAWANAKMYRRIAAELVQLEAGRAMFDLAALRDDPETALHGNTEVTVEYDMNPKGGCSVFGYYRPQPTGQSLIMVHPSLTSERDSFTILHELGHHVQRQHAKWANVRYSFAGTAGSQLEERVADAFAAEVLIPADTISAEASWLNAQTLSDIYGRVRASRSAVAMRAIEITPEDANATVLVTDGHGLVIFARASGDSVFAPARGRVQPGIAKLLGNAFDNGGHAYGDLSEGLQSVSGWTQSDLTAQVSLDHTWSYAFAVIRPAQGFGQRARWERTDDAECSREACGEMFSVDETIEYCKACNAPRCPQCRSCSCEPKQATACEECWIMLSVAEQLNPSLHECS